MSKSLGNFIDLEQLQDYINTYGRGALRYFLAVQGPLGATDSDFSRQQFHDTYTSDLVNTFGNCSSRTSAMIGKYFDGVLPKDIDTSIGDVEWSDFCATQVSKSIDAMERFELGSAIASAMAIVRAVDLFINDTAPFKLAKDPENTELVGAILYRCAEAIRIAACLLESVLPEAVGTLREAWSLGPATGDLANECIWGRFREAAVVQKVALFPRVDASAAASSSS